MLLLWTLGAIPRLFHFFGNWWPLLLILLGLGKLVDAMVWGRPPKVRGGEIVFILFLILIGFTLAQFAMNRRKQDLY